MSKKDVILDTALRLFNETNTQSATTNHIAKAMGISPGNLHYHYKNREEIVRLLYMRMREELTLPIEKLPKNIIELNEHEKLLVEIQWKYRFFFKEILFLFSKDKELETLYIKDNIANRQRIKMVMINLINNNELIVEDENILEYLVDSILLSWQFYNSYLHTLGEEIDSCSAHKVVAYTNNAIRPYLKNML